MISRGSNFNEHKEHPRQVYKTQTTSVLLGASCNHLHMNHPSSPFPISAPNKIPKMATIQIADLLLDTYTKGLNTLLHILDVAASHAAANNLNPDAYFDARLIDDQRPLSFQIQNGTRQIRIVIARVSGVDVPGVEDTEKTLDDFRARITSTIEFLKGVDRAGIDAFVGRGEIVTQ